jgi:hypothetical protein
LKHTYYEKNTEAVVDASKEIGLEVSAEKITYMIMSRDQNAGQNHSIKTGNNSFERVEQFKYSGTTLTNQNHINEEIKNIDVKECLLSFSEESCLPLCYPKT